MLAGAEDEAKNLRDEYISIEHLLLASTEDTGAAGRLLSSAGATRDRLMQALRQIRGSQRVTSPDPKPPTKPWYGMAAISPPLHGRESLIR